MKFTRILLITVMIVCQLFTASWADVKGDFDGNGKLGLEDVIGILQVLTGLRTDSPQPGGKAPFIPEAPVSAATHWVSPSGNDNNSGSEAQPWRQISHAATEAQPGDVIEILDGEYATPIIIGNKSGTATAPIIFRAQGGNAIVNGSGTSSGGDQRDAIYIHNSTYIIIHGLKESGAYRGGARVSLSGHITIQACMFGNNGKWGVFTDFADDITLTGNECYGSINEHGIYHSNSGDRAVIRGNYLHDNYASGIQINADPSMGGDGISSACIIERNLIIRNGDAGGAAVNLASVRYSQIRNNVIYSNKAGGIAMWDDGQGSQWGCKNNVIMHNTVVHYTGEGRFALSIKNGSSGNNFGNNIFMGGQRGAWEWTADSMPSTASDYNLYFSVDGYALFEEEDVRTYDLAGLRTVTGGDAHSSDTAPVFNDAGSGDYSLTSSSPGRDSGINSSLTECYDGSDRPKGIGFDMGAYDN